MPVLPHHVSVRQDPDGLPVVGVTFHVSSDQLAAAVHALRTIREARYRTSELGTDDVLAMRELTCLIDELADMPPAGGYVPLQATVGRLAIMRDALHDFAAAEHQEREGDAVARPRALTLVDALDDLYGQAVRAALDGQAPAIV